MKKSWVVIPTTKTLVCTSRLMKRKTMCTEEEALPWADREPASTEEVKVLNHQLECGRRYIRIRKARIGPNLLEMFLQWGLTMLSVNDCFSSLKRVSRFFNRLCKYPCMACQFKDMVCAVHVVMNHHTIIQPSPFDPPLKIYGSRKFDGYHESDSEEELEELSGSEDDGDYRFQPVESTRLPHRKMLRYPQALTKKHASMGICRKYVNGKCNRSGCCPYSHSLVGVEAEKDKQRYQTRRNGQRYQTR